MSQKRGLNGSIGIIGYANSDVINAQYHVTNIFCNVSSLNFICQT